MAHEFCVAHGIRERIYPADWAAHGNGAGPIRNKAMATAGADLCCAWWDGLSKGTGGMISLACQARIRVLVIPS